MRRDLMDILACPICKREFTLTVTSSEGAEDGDEEIMEGSLHCAACNERYPINDGIPNLLPPDLRQEMEAAAAHSGTD